MADNLEPIVESSQAQCLATDFVFTEGPLWHPDGYWLFVDLFRPVPAIYRLSPGGLPETEREPSGGTNGMTFDLQGRLIMCEGDNRQVSRREANGDITVLADRWEGKRLNRPNDVVCRSDGSIYFTDPSLRVPPEEREYDVAGVFQIDPDGQLHLRADECEYPNGLAFSPDESRLYIIDSPQIRVFDVKADGTIENDRLSDRRADQSEIRAPKLLPLRHHGQRVRAFQCFFRRITKR